MSAWRAAGAPFEPKLVKLHKGEHRTPEYLALNPERPGAGAACRRQAADPDRRHLRLHRPRVPGRPVCCRGTPWERSQALSQLAWMNSTPHTTATRLLLPERYAESEAAQAEVKQRAAEEFRGHLERVEGWRRPAAYWLGERLSFHDAYAFTLLRWGGFAGIDPARCPRTTPMRERVMQQPPVAAALARERIRLDTYKGLVEVTLTFDNGPEPAVTAARARHPGQAADPRHFLRARLQARRSRRAARIAKRAHAEGHWIGNHTMTHSTAARPPPRPGEGDRRDHRDPGADRRARAPGPAVPPVRRRRRARPASAQRAAVEVLQQASG